VVSGASADNVVDHLPILQATVPIDERSHLDRPCCALCVAFLSPCGHLTHSRERRGRARDAALR
jgi:hypothetical protein